VVPVVSEANFWQLIRKNVPGHLVRIENHAGTGQPDVNYCIAGVEGWIELKYLEAFPKRQDTMVRIPHFEPEQRIWLTQRKNAGGRVFLFVRVDGIAGGFFLFDGKEAARHIGVNWIREEWNARALKSWAPRMNWGELVVEMVR
jgi:hypothetical protein